MENKILDKKTIETFVPIFAININDLISADTYDENKIFKKIKELPESDQILLAKAAVQMSVIGYGKKNYGSIRVDNNVVVPLVNIFKKYNIRYNENIDSKYNDDDLSARRLVRLFRFQIQDFIVKNNRPSFLWSKYSLKDKSKIYVCFPGAEYLVETKEDAEYLLRAYKKLDNNQKTNFVTRLIRIYIIREIFTPFEIEDLLKSL